MTGEDRDLETRLGWVSMAFVLLFGAAFAAGLGLHVVRPGGPASATLLQAALVLLMAAPAARVLIAVAERIRRRDWLFVVMTLVVTAELALVMVRASRNL